MVRIAACLLVVGLTLIASADDVESRVLTHYVPQDFLEEAVRKEGWTEIPLNVKGGVRKGDIVRIWSGGSIDRGNGDYPGQHVGGPAALESKGLLVDSKRFALAPDPALAFALLFKTAGKGVRPAMIPGKPLEIPLLADREQLWVGFNDERGRYHDNHIGKGRRHELDPLWVRIEVVRIVVD
ncbi:MAG TPA: hypothetical protein VEL76_07765 [Gemmataceae bacterium]|nr:hypothetical protein [Gemmataceae bacterium]